MAPLAATAMALMASLAAALPAPVADAETTVAGPPVVYQTAAAAPLVTAVTLDEPAATTAPAKVKRDGNICYPQPTGIAHKSSPDTADAFRADPFYSDAASGAPLPSGFSAAFINTGASPNADMYLGFTLLDTYDVATCARKCQAIDECRSFNIYFERDPSVNPDDASCANPPSVTNIKCVWWGSLISPANNVNSGQWRNQFEVVIAGSNGYTVGAAPSASSTTSSSASSTAAPTSPTTSSISSSAAATTTTSPAATATPTNTPARQFRLRTDGSTTPLDQHYLAVQPQGAGNVDLNAAPKKAQSSTFQLSPTGQLLQLTPQSGRAAVTPNQSGVWAPLEFKGTNSNGLDYLSCTGDSVLTCSGRNGAQTFGVCPADASKNKQGLLWIGQGAQMPAGCKRVQLYVERV